MRQFILNYSRHKAISASVTLVLVVLLLFMFQNCTDPLEQNKDDGSSFANSLPFAYDFKTSHIGYMSCSNLPNPPATRPFFTFRVGAYRQGSGLKFSDEFLRATKNLSESQRMEVVSQGSKNSDITLQLSVRDKRNYQKIQTAADNSAREEFDFANYLYSRPLDDPVISQTVAGLPSGGRANFFSGINSNIPEDRLLSQSIYFTNNDVQAKSLHSFLLNRGLLTITYAKNNPEEAFLAQAPVYGSQDSVYGTGFQVGFGAGHNMQQQTFLSVGESESRVLTGIVESDLVSGQRQGGWTCPAALNFMIVENADAGAAGCRPLPDAPGDPLLKDIRPLLPVEDWWVDIERRCVILKQGTSGCYAKDAVIDYSGSSCGREGENDCPHYVSFCYRFTD